jgi:hypothetical protein
MPSEPKNRIWASKSKLDSFELGAQMWTKRFLGIKLTTSEMRNIRICIAVIHYKNSRFNFHTHPACNL